jgi:uncharacterized protein (TIGR00290 family)
MKKTLLSWSSGKDSAWALHALQQMPDIELVGLFSTYNQEFERIAMHSTRLDLVRMQAKRTGLPIELIPLPFPCSNEDYEQIMGAFTKSVIDRDITHIAFGDLSLEDVRQYRIDKLAGTGITPIFPIWGIPTEELSRTMVASGLKSQITCINPKQIPEKFAGAEFNLDFIESLPESVDPCGENGEFHSFAFAGPMFTEPIPIIVGETVKRDGFIFTDVLLKE